MYIAATNPLATPNHAISTASGAKTLTIPSVWSNGFSEKGEVVLLRNERDTNLTADVVDERYAGKVLIIGGQATAEGLHAAASHGVNAVIAASMEARYVQYAQQLPMAVVLTNGFGMHLMRERTWMLFVLNNQRDARINNVSRTDNALQQAEIVLNVGLANDKTAVPAWQPLQEGQQVLVLDTLNPNLTGTVVKLPRGRQRIASGLRVQTALVQLLSGDQIDVPVANLQILPQLANSISA